MKFILIYLFIFKLSFGEELLCPKECDCDTANGLNRAVCDNQNIVTIDIGVPDSVQSYNLRSNAINELDNYCFKNVGYTSLVDLNLSNNHIFWIGVHAFAGLTELKHLDLSHNRLRYVAYDLLMDTPNLEHLDLSGNLFEGIKNLPILAHPKLKILNLSSCRISYLPTRVFTGLPALNKLDLSDNNMISIQKEVFFPLKRLQKLELRSETWKCLPYFIEFENWIIDRSVDYKRQCKGVVSKMSENMVAVSEDPNEPVDVRKVWNITKTPTTAVEVKKRDKNLTMMERFNRDYPSFWALIVGLEIGFVFGVFGTYIWLQSICKCGHLNCKRPKTRRERRRARMIDIEMRRNLVWNSVLNSESGTPTFLRREMSLPERFPHILGDSLMYEGSDTSRTLSESRPETPPPSYNECRVLIPNS